LRPRSCLGVALARSPRPSPQLLYHNSCPRQRALWLQRAVRLSTHVRRAVSIRVGSGRMPIRGARGRRDEGSQCTRHSPRCFDKWAAALAVLRCPCARLAKVGGRAPARGTRTSNKAREHGRDHSFLFSVHIRILARTDWVAPEASKNVSTGAWLERRRSRCWSEARPASLTSRTPCCPLRHGALHEPVVPSQRRRVGPHRGQDARPPHLAPRAPAGVVAQPAQAGAHEAHRGGRGSRSGAPLAAVELWRRPARREARGVWATR